MSKKNQAFPALYEVSLSVASKVSMRTNRWAPGLTKASEDDYVIIQSIIKLVSTRLF